MSFFRSDSSFSFLVHPQNKLYNSLSKQLSIFNYQTILHFSNKFDKLEISLREDYRSTIVKSNDTNIRDDHNLNFLVDYTFSQYLSPGFILENSILSDSRSIGINSASNTNLIAFNKFVFSNHISFAPYFGYQENKQAGVVDNGYIWGIESFSNELTISEIRLNSLIKLRREMIIPRENNLMQLSTSMYNDIDDNISNELFVSYSKNRRDFYFIADSITSKEFKVVNNILSRADEQIQIKNLFLYDNFISSFSFYLLPSINLRTVDRNTKYKSLSNASPSTFDNQVNEQKLEIETGINYLLNFGYLNFKGYYSERNEKHSTKNITGINEIFFDERKQLEFRKDNVSKFTSLSFIMNINLSNSDRILLNLSHNKLQYDTPSPDNPDDRDELLSMVKISYYRTINPHFVLFLSGEGHLGKLVYISEKRSSNNYTNRVLTLTTGGEIKNKFFRTLNSFQVTANYTVYDFEDLRPNFSSFAYRHFLVDDSTTVLLYKSTFFKFSGRYKISEQGELYWKRFAMKPSRLVEEMLLTPTISVILSGVELGAGFKYFELNTYRYLKDKKVIDNQYKSMGPTSYISYLKDRISISFIGSYERIFQQNSVKTDFANVNIDINWFF